MGLMRRAIGTEYIGTRRAAPLSGGAGELIVCKRNPAERRCRICETKNVRNVLGAVVNKTTLGGNSFKALCSSVRHASLAGTFRLY
jgi:hypothetical protein